MIQNAGHNPFDQIRRRATRSASEVSDVLSSLSNEDRRRVRQLISEPQDYIDSEAFYEEGAAEKIYDLAPEIRKPDASWYVPVMDNVGPKTRTPSSSDQVILTAAEERVIFLQFNFARHSIEEIRKQVINRPNAEPTIDEARAMLRWDRTADRLRLQIAETNLALVLAMAKRTRMNDMDYADLVSEGNMALMRAVDKFDCGRGFKFSTYACRAILKAFSRQGMKLTKYRQRFPTDFDPKLERSNHTEESREAEVRDTASEVKRIVLQNTAGLSDIERTVIGHRYRLEDEDAQAKPMTLEQVGQVIGVTKERVRQIQNKALEKIRIELEDNYLNVGAEMQVGKDLADHHYN